MAARTAKAERTSAETQIRLSLNLDGEGKVHVDTGFGMLDHMLTLTFFWARMDLELKCTGLHGYSRCGSGRPDRK